MDVGDECKTQDVGINTALPVIEQLEGRIVVCVTERERDQTTEGIVVITNLAWSQLLMTR